MGIIICGLNGAGKSTLGKALAQRLHYDFIDVEDLYFPKTDPAYPYAVQRTQEEVEKLLLNEVSTHENFIFAAVKGDYGEAIYSFFQYAVLLEVPRELRLERVKSRSFQKFGSRILPGGDLWEHEEGFFDLVRSRDENMVEKWVRNLSCPVIRADGTRPVEENIDFITGQMQIHD